MSWRLISLAIWFLRLYAAYTWTINFLEYKMAKQAKVLTQQELRRVLDYVATRKHADRNRAIILTMLNEAIQVRNFACRNFW